MASTKAKFSATSKAGNTRTVDAEYVSGKLVGTFTYQPLFGEPVVKSGVEIQGSLERLSHFSLKQSGMFCKWVDGKLGVVK